MLADGPRRWPDAAGGLIPRGFPTSIASELPRHNMAHRGSMWAIIN